MVREEIIDNYVIYIEDVENAEENTNVTDNNDIIPELPPAIQDTYIFFDINKQAHTQPILNYYAKDTKERWQKFKFLKLGQDYDVTANGIVDLRQTESYIAEKLKIKRVEKHAENTQKAKQAVENGYVTYKEAQFETNAQTVGDLTATMLMLQNERAEAESLAESKTDISYTWLSKDDKAVELTVEDFVTLGNLIAQYKNKVWNEKYLEYKTAIENAQTIEELNEIELDYGNFDI